MNARRRFIAWVAVPFGVVVAASLVVTNAGAADPVPGSQGTDTSLPATDSQVTVNGRGRFADLAITVNQTDHLTNQAVSITWTGGKPTNQGPGRFAGNFLQIMQCWGDDDESIEGNPGPPPEQCVQGAVAGTYGGLPGGLYPAGFSMGRVISRTDWLNYDAQIGVVDDRTTNVWRPFRAVDGTEVDVHTDPTFNPSVVGGNFWQNPFFNIITTNEIAGAVTGRDGTGAELMQVLTGVESSGLGCGQAVQPTSTGDRTIPQCWIVVVPRGAPGEENIGTPFESNADQFGVMTSPVAPAAWANRIAVPIEFNPVDSPCSLAEQERRIAGSQLALAAVSSWQPALCVAENLPPYSYSTVSDAQARQQLTSASSGSPGMVVVPRPIPPANVSPSNPVVYAPLTLSGLVIGFNVERSARLNAPDAQAQLDGRRIAELDLTPRLVAKLLTQSYSVQVSIVAGSPKYPWLARNPPHLGADPDFLQFNPEFNLLSIASARNFGGLSLPAGNSDAAQQVWEWVLADPEARAWLDGAADPWGMQINPVYATTAAANANGNAFGEPVPSSFPKADPYCYQAPPRGPGNSIVPPLVCGTDWLPSARSFADAAQVTRAASDGARVVDNEFAAAANQVWARELPQYLGKRSFLSLTDTASAAQFGLQVARLSRAGDNSAERRFVAPDTSTLLAGVETMAPRAVPSVLEPAAGGSPSDAAYPLTSVTYAAIAPLALDSTARAEYAAFLEYTAAPGQTVGFDPGQLPRGYAPLPEWLRAQTLESAAIMRSVVAPPPPESIPETPPTFEPTETTTPESLPETVSESVPEAPAEVAEVPSGGGTASQSGGGSRQRSSGSSTSADTSPSSVTEPAPVTESVETAVVEPDPLTEELVETEEDSLVSTLTTPLLAVGRSRYAVPGLAATALFSLLGALEITKSPRRARGQIVGEGSQ